jgi:hypothetical protein
VLLTESLQKLGLKAKFYDLGDEEIGDEALHVIEVVRYFVWSLFDPNKDVPGVTVCMHKVVFHQH